MLEVTTIGSHSHVGSQALGEDHFLTSDFQLISCLMLPLEFMVLSQHGDPDVTVSGFKSGELEGQSSLLNEPVRIQSVLHDARTLRVVLVEIA